MLQILKLILLRHYQYKHFEMSDRQIEQNIIQKDINLTQTQNIHTRWLNCDQLVFWLLWGFCVLFVCFGVCGFVCFFLFFLHITPIHVSLFSHEITKTDFLCTGGSPFSHSLVHVAAVAIHSEVMCMLAAATKQNLQQPSATCLPSIWLRNVSLKTVQHPILM